VPVDTSLLAPGQHGITGLQVNSVPLSETIEPGLPRRATIVVSSRAPRRPEIEVSGIAPSRATSATTRYEH
jgi:hypothetical protein